MAIEPERTANTAVSVDISGADERRLCAEQQKKNIENLENISKDVAMMEERFHDLLVRSALVNVQTGMLFDPTAVEVVQERQVGCIKCSQSANELFENHSFF